MKIRNNNLIDYFLRPHHQLPRSYLDHCNNFFDELKEKRQAGSGKPRALKKQLHKPGQRVKNRFNRKV